MVDYDKINADPVAVVPDHQVLYISGPMSHCKSKPDMVESDFNYGTFNAIEADFMSRGFEVVNPTKTQANIDAQLKETGISGADPMGWQALLKQDLLSMIQSGVTDVIFIPPAHTMNSTPENPEFRTWKDSSGACVEAMFAYKLGANFGQAIENEDGTYRVEPLSREEIRETLANSKTLKDLQQDYKGPAINQGAQALESPKSAESQSQKTVPASSVSPWLVAGHSDESHDHEESASVKVK